MHFPKLQARQGWPPAKKNFHADPNKDACFGYSIPDLPGITARVQPSQDLARVPIYLRWASHSARLCPAVHESTGVFAKWRAIPFLFCSGLQLHGNADNVEPIRTSLLVPKASGPYPWSSRHSVRSSWSQNVGPSNENYRTLLNVLKSFHLDIRSTDHVIKI